MNHTPRGNRYVLRTTLLSLAIGLGLILFWAAAQVLAQNSSPQTAGAGTQSLLEGFRHVEVASVSDAAEQAQDEAGETYAVDTEWYPTRAGKDLLGVTDAGVIAQHLRISGGPEGQNLTGRFGVFFAEDRRQVPGQERQTNLRIEMRSVTPEESVKLEERIRIPKGASRIILQLIDSQGRQRRELDAGEAYEQHIAIAAGSDVFSFVLP